MFRAFLFFITLLTTSLPVSSLSDEIETDEDASLSRAPDRSPAVLLPTQVPSPAEAGEETEVWVDLVDRDF